MGYSSKIVLKTSFEVQIEGFSGVEIYVCGLLSYDTITNFSEEYIISILEVYPKDGGYMLFQGRILL
jgi:hypothetical protein